MKSPSDFKYGQRIQMKQHAGTVQHADARFVFVHFDGSSLVVPCDPDWLT